MSSHTMTYTLADLLTAYEKEYLPHKAPTTRYQHTHLFAWLKRDLGAMPLRDLTPAFLRAWRDKLLTRYAPGTVRRYLAALGAPLAVAVRDYDWLPTNPMKKVLKPPETPGRVRYLSPEELEKLLAACRQSRNPHLATIVLLALSTGARKTQLRMLRWRDLDFTRRTVRLSLSKRTAARRLPLRGPVVAVLQAQSVRALPEEWVFARHDGKQPIFFDAAFVIAAKRAGIDDLHFHDLRHTTGSYLAMNGARIREVAEILGHKNIQMTMKYMHLSEGHTGEVLGKMVDRFLASLLAAATLTMLASVALAWG